MTLKKIMLPGGYLLFLYLFIFLSTCLAQQEFVKKNQYEIGPDEKLLINVHIWGEVTRPGGYLVPDDTDILELISEAGGPTEYANLSRVKITRGLTRIIDTNKTSKIRTSSVDRKAFYNKYTKHVIKIDLKRLLDKENNYEALLTLQPGDVVRITRNTWFKWQTAIRVISQLAVVAQVWYWYSQAD